MAWFRKEKKPRQPRRERLEIPADVWEKCEACGHTDIREKFVRNVNVCPNCDYPSPHPRDRLLQHPARRRVDGGAGARTSAPPIRSAFRSIRRACKKATTNAGEGDALLAATGTIEDLPVNLGVMDFAFMGGSMGSVVGEKIARLGQRSLERKHPLIVICASGGARMQEGVLSLMQMAKVSAVLAQLAERRIPYIADPHESHHGRRERELRDARRRDPRRAGRGDRLRRPARHQADARAGSPGGIPDGGVPPRPRHGRPGGAPART